MSFGRKFILSSLLIATSVVATSGPVAGSPGFHRHSLALKAASKSTQPIELVLDINTGEPGSDIYSSAAFGDLLIFGAKSKSYGGEIWRSDGTTIGTFMLKDIVPGTGSSWPMPLGAIGDSFYFVSQGNIGQQLWRTDGTEAGTVLVKALGGISTDDDSAPFLLSSTSTSLLFVGLDATHGAELWRTDGTEAGTALVKDINPGKNPAIDSRAMEHETLNGVTYFRADDGAHGSELWRTDGTEAGTALVKDVSAGVMGSDPLGLTAVGGYLVMSAKDQAHGEELWRTDGTEAGTVLVKDINPGPMLSLPSSITRFKDQAIFLAGDLIHGRELWKTDGTEAGTVLVKDINPGKSDSSALPLGANDSSGFLAATDADHGEELWMTDGTEAGTVLVKDINPGRDGSEPAFAHGVIDGVLYLSADNGQVGRELWRSEGSASSTEIVNDFNPGRSHSDFQIIDVVGDTVYISLDDGVHGQELWRMKSTVKPIKSVKTGSVSTLSALIRVPANPTTEWDTSGGCTVKGTRLVAPRRSATCSLTVEQTVVVNLRVKGHKVRTKTTASKKLTLKIRP